MNRFRLLPFALALTSALILAACAAAARNPHAPTLKANAKDAAAAKTITISAKDLPVGFKLADPPSANFDGRVACPTYDPDLSGITVTGLQDGSTFSRENARGGAFVSSSVIIFKSEADAKKYVTAVRKPAFIACMKKELAKTGVADVTGNASASVSGPLQILDWSLGGTLKKQGAPFNSEIIFVRRGRGGLLIIFSDTAGSVTSKEASAIGQKAALKLIAASY